MIRIRGFNMAAAKIRKLFLEMWMTKKTKKQFYIKLECFHR